MTNIDRQDAELAALRAEVARQGEAIRVIDGWLVGRELRAADPATYVPWIGEPHNALLAALAAPVPPAGAPLPGPVADAVMRRAGPLSPLPPEVEAAEAVIRKASDAGLFDAKPETARALAAWARAQQQPALGDDVREVMREAAGMLDDLNRETPPNGWDYAGSAGGWRVSGVPVKVMAARLRELAGEP